MSVGVDEAWEDDAVDALGREPRVVRVDEDVTRLAHVHDRAVASDDDRAVGERRRVAEEQVVCVDGSHVAILR